MSQTTQIATLEAWSMLATAIFTALLFFAACWAGSVAVKTMNASEKASAAAERANEQLQRDSEARTRPYVFIEVLPSIAGPKTFDILIRNVGGTPARNLTLEFSDWPMPLDDVASSVKQLFEHPRTLPPGCSIRAYWRMVGPFSDGTEEAGMPVKGTIKVSYSGADERGTSYHDAFGIDVDQAGLWPIADDGPEPPKTLDSDAKSFYKLGQTIARAIGGLAR